MHPFVRFVDDSLGLQKLNGRLRNNELTIGQANYAATTRQLIVGAHRHLSRRERNPRVFHTESIACRRRRVKPDSCANSGVLPRGATEDRQITPEGKLAEHKL